MRVKKFASLAAFNAQKANLEYPGIFMIADGTNVDGVAKNITAAASFNELLTPMSRFNHLEQAVGKAVWSNGTNFVIGDIQNSDAKDKQKFIAAGYQLIGWAFHFESTEENEYELQYDMSDSGTDYYVINQTDTDNKGYLYIVGVNPVSGAWVGSLEDVSGLSNKNTEYQALLAKTYDYLVDTKSLTDLNQEKYGVYTDNFTLDTVRYLVPELVPADIYTQEETSNVSVNGSFSKKFINDGKTLTKEVYDLLGTNLTSCTYQGQQIPVECVFRSVHNYTTLGTRAGDWFIPTKNLVDKFLDRIVSGNHKNGNYAYFPMLGIGNADPENIMVATGFEEAPGYPKTTHGGNINASGDSRYGYTLYAQNIELNEYAYSAETQGKDVILPVLRLKGSYNSYTFEIG